LYPQIPAKERYPLMTDLLWFVLARYVYVLTGSRFICSDKPLGPVPPKVSLSKLELRAIENIYAYLARCAQEGVGPPKAISTPGALVREAERAMLEHQDDDQSQVASDKPLLIWPHEKVGTIFGRRRASLVKRRRSSDSDPEYGDEYGQKKKTKTKKTGRPLSAKLNTGGKRVRRIRCRECPGW
jgi:F-box/leucine-rich repeat protein 10/11